MASDVRRSTTINRAKAMPVISGERAAKRSSAVAARIVADVIAAGWPEGEVLGSESELLERYGVSRAVFREAVRLVEHQQVGRMRRGPGGGLVVTSPTLESVIDPVAVYLFYANATVGDVADARLALEESVTELAPSRLSERDIDELRQLAERERAGRMSDFRELHNVLATMTRNPALEVFVNLLSRLTKLYSPDIRKVRKQTIGEAAYAHEAIVNAVVAGDEGLARHRMRTHLEAEAAYLRRRVLPGQRLDPTVLRSLGDGDKRGERVARAIFVDVVESGWPVGTLLGSETELMARFDVSRAGLREAIRLLEHHQIAATRRGPGGGLFVVRPGIESAVDAIATLLERRGIRASDLFEVRLAVELTVVDVVARRLDAAGAAELAEVLERERAASPLEFSTTGHDLHAALATLTGNPVFELLALVLLRLTHRHQVRPRLPADVPAAEVHRIHSAIVEAIVRKDVGLARHRMRRHLDKVAAFVG